MNVRDLRIVKDLFGHIPSIFLYEPTSQQLEYPVVESTGTLLPSTFSNCGESSSLQLDTSKEKSGVMNDYQGSIVSTGSVTIDAGSAEIRSNMNLSNLELGETYVFSIVGNKESGYFCAINKFS